jgi:hypothetical protein
MQRKKKRISVPHAQVPAPVPSAAAASGPPKRVYGLAISLEDLRTEKDDSEEEDEEENVDDAHAAIHTAPPVDTEALLLLPFVVSLWHTTFLLAWRWLITCRPDTDACPVLHFPIAADGGVRRQD